MIVTADFLVGWSRLVLVDVVAGRIVDVPPLSALLSLTVEGGVRCFLLACFSHVAFFRTLMVEEFLAALSVWNVIASD